MENLVEILRHDGATRIRLRLSKTVIAELIRSGGETTMPLSDFFHGWEVPTDSAEHERLGQPLDRLTLVTRFDTPIPWSRDKAMDSLLDLIFSGVERT